MEEGAKMVSFGGIRLQYLTNVIYARRLRILHMAFHIISPIAGVYQSIAPYTMQSKWEYWSFPKSKMISNYYTWSEVIFQLSNRINWLALHPVLVQVVVLP